MIVFEQLLASWHLNVIPYKRDSNSPQLFPISRARISAPGGHSEIISAVFISDVTLLCFVIILCSPFLIYRVFHCASPEMYRPVQAGWSLTLTPAVRSCIINRIRSRERHVEWGAFPRSLCPYNVDKDSEGGYIASACVRARARDRASAIPLFIHYSRARE